MKKALIVLIIFFLFSTVSNAQNSRWFIVLTPGYGIGGPGVSIKANMNQSGFNQSQDNWLFGGTNTYPKVSHEPTLLLTIGKHVSEFGSICVTAGQTTAGTVTGYNGQSNATLDYNVWQFTGSYQFGFANTHFKVGVGPSLFYFKYSQNYSYQATGSSNSVIKPGLSVITRIPLGAEKRLFGMELFFELNIASGATVKQIDTYGPSLPACNVSLIHSVVGISFAFGH
jgi:hypothetical protein